MAVKTTTKKTPDKLSAAILLMTTSLAESAKKMAKTEAELSRRLAESRDELSRRMAESEDKTRKSLDELSRRLAESRDELSKRMAESRDELSKRMAESSAKTDKTLQKLSDEVALVNAGLGGIGRGFGELTELIVVPKIRLEINKYGHEFKRSKANKKFRFNSGVATYRKDIVTEVDMFLYNHTETMAIEIKTTLSAQDVEKHTKQLEMLRKYEAETELRGKKLYGAMVGVLVDYHARKLALKNGLYVLEILEEEKRMKTDAPPCPRAW